MNDSDMAQFGILRSPSAVLFGPRQRGALPKVVRTLGSRAYVVTDERQAADPIFQSLMKDLTADGIVLEVFAGCIPELPLECVRRCAGVGRSFGPDVIVGIGGGSSLDTAKMAAVVIAYGEDIASFYGENNVPGPVMPIVALPTTSGTGSEVSPVAVVTDPDRIMKVGVSSPFIIPTVAICDPELTITCPPSLTANSGVDALTHAIEAFTAVKREPSSDLGVNAVFVGKNMLSDQFALTAISHIAKSLLKAIRDGGDLRARGDLMLGALHAGWAFGTAGTAAAHAIQYPLGAITHSPHGIGVATLLPYVMEFNLPACVYEFAQIALAIDPSLRGETTRNLANIAVERVAELLYAAGVPRTLFELGLREDQIKWTVEQAATVTRLIRNNPRPLNLDGIEKIARAAFIGKREAVRAA